MKGQLWPRLKYELGALPVKLEDLDSKKKNAKEYGLGTRDHKILSRLGICQNIDKEWRYYYTTVLQRNGPASSED